jgi:hypothetical protein
MEWTVGIHLFFLLLVQGTKLNIFILYVTVKPQFSVPAFSEFLYLVNILSGPGQSPI